MHRIGRWGSCILLGLAWTATVAQAQQSTARAVRLSVVDGHVTLAQDNQVLADPALPNTPLLEGAQLTTSEDGRAEIQLEDGSVARLSPNSSLTLSVLRGQGSSSTAEITLDSGLGYLELQGVGQAGTIQLRLASNLITTSGFTILRASLDHPAGELAVFSGNTHVETGSAPLDLHGGQSAAFGPSGPLVADSIEPDSWDSWNADRDEALNAAEASQTGAANGAAQSANPAWSDLDASGNWYNVPGQGNIWSPYEAADAGWDPYSNGSWVWTPRYGYLWVSGNSWGYMPYQCGMWNYYNGFGWGWSVGAGGCQPWWGGAGYAINIGIYPGGYRMPLMPRPHPLPPHLLPPGRGRIAAYPVIAVNRSTGFTSATFAARDRNTPVVIGGHTVMPLRPLAPRNSFHREPQFSAPRPASEGNYRQPGTPAQPPRTGNAERHQPMPQHTQPPPRYAPPPEHYSPPPHSPPPPPPSGGSPSHNSGGEPSHTSTGGGTHHR